MSAKIRVIKKEIRTDCDLCEREDIDTSVAVLEDGRVYMVCESCIECLRKIFKAEMVNQEVKG